MKKIIVVFLVLLSILVSGCISNEPVQKIINRTDDSVVIAAYRHLAPGNKDGLYCSRILGVWGIFDNQR